MSKQCPKCGNQLPDEASFCLVCFNDDVDAGCNTQELDGIITKSEKRSRKSPLLILKQKRRNIAKTAVILFVLLIFAVSAGGITKIVLEKAPASDGQSKRSDKASNNITVNNYGGEINPDTTPDGVPSLEDESPSASLPNEDPSEGVTESNTENGQQQEIPGAETPSGNTPETETGTAGTTNPKPTSPTSPPATTNPKPTSPPATTEPPAPTKPEYDKFEYGPLDGNTQSPYIEITKYTGNASHVLIPAKIDGKYVRDIESGAFVNNSKIKTVTFENDPGQSSLSIVATAFDNLPSLTTINLTANYPVFNGLSFRNCPNLAKVNVTHPNYRTVGGAIYDTNGKMRFYCPASPETEHIIPSWSPGIDKVCNIEEARFLKVIKFHKNTTSFLSAWNHPASLEKIIVEESNPYAISIDGVLYFDKDSNGYYNSSVYPMSSKNKEYKIPENVHVQAFNDGKVNYALETIRLPKSSVFQSASNIWPNLKTIYIQKGHPQYENIKEFYTNCNIVLY